MRSVQGFTHIENNSLGIDRKDRKTVGTLSLLACPDECSGAQVSAQKTGANPSTGSGQALGHRAFSMHGECPLSHANQ